MSLLCRITPGAIAAEDRRLDAYAPIEETEKVSRCGSTAEYEQITSPISTIVRNPNQ
jgi:hypothetical protein